MDSEGLYDTPEQWAARQKWRKVLEVGNHSETRKAHRLREYLVDAKVYPTRDVASDESHEVHEARMRAEMPDILAALDRTDLQAIHDTARLLAIVPRDPEIFEYSHARSALALAGSGIDPRAIGIELDATLADDVDSLLAAVAQRGQGPDSGPGPMLDGIRQQVGKINWQCDRIEREYEEVQAERDAQA